MAGSEWGGYLRICPLEPPERHHYSRCMVGINVPPSNTPGAGSLTLSQVNTGKVSITLHVCVGFHCVVSMEGLSVRGVNDIFPQEGNYHLQTHPHAVQHWHIMRENKYNIIYYSCKFESNMHTSISSSMYYSIEV